jgi:hypothetical protein
MSVGDRFGSLTRPENVMYSTLPSEHVIAATRLTTVLMSRSLTEKLTLKGDAVTVPNRVNAESRTSRWNTTLVMEAGPLAFVTSTMFVSVFLPSEKQQATSNKQQILHLLRVDQG